MDFEQWLAALFGQKQTEIEKVLKDETALHFLMAWSLFEAKCFGGFLKSCCLEGFARRMIAESFDHAKICEAARHFYDRYQDPQLLKTLLQKDTKALKPRMTVVLATPFDDLQPES
jgi:hypothetical protein